MVMPALSIVYTPFRSFWTLTCLFFQSRQGPPAQYGRQHSSHKFSLAPPHIMHKPHVFCLLCLYLKIETPRDLTYCTQMHNPEIGEINVP